jgi:hypothetical protein
MSDGPIWFAPKRYGYGATPVSWQGWALTLVVVGLIILTSATFSRRPVVLLAILIPIIASFLVICARTTRGGWRWRWGDED